MVVYTTYLYENVPCMYYFLEMSKQIKKTIFNAVPCLDKGNNKITEHLSDL